STDITPAPQDVSFIVFRRLRASKNNGLSLEIMCLRLRPLSVLIFYATCSFCFALSVALHCMCLQEFFRRVKAGFPFNGFPYFFAFFGTYGGGFVVEGISHKGKHSRHVIIFKQSSERSHRHLSRIFLTEHFDRA